MIKPRFLKIREAAKDLQNAQNFNEWQQAAGHYDQLQGHDLWREQDESPYYPYQLVSEHLRQLRQYRQRQEFDALISFLQESLLLTLGELTHPGLYNVSLQGTKRLIEDYLDEVETAIMAICDAPQQHISTRRKQALFDHSAEMFGRSALMLSGGGTMGIYHLGVVKVLLENRLLPEVTSGSSMGALVNGFIATHSDEEILERIENPELLHLVPFKMNPPREMRRQGAFFEDAQMLDFVSANIRDCTFREAYERSGRIINVTVSPSQAGQRARILNYKLTPDALISHACKASAAVPKVFAPTQLMARGADGIVKPFMGNERWIDGSVHIDVPMQRLTRLHNTNHFIVSQTNPLVLPFVKPRESKGASQYMRDLAVSSLTTQCHQVIKISKQRVKNRSTRFWLDQADALVGQDYLGNINILPDEISIKRYARLLTNPTVEEVKDFIRMGERATWPKLTRIRDETRISRVLHQCQKKLRQAAVSEITPEPQRLQEVS